MQQQQAAKSCSSENAAKAFAILVSHYCDRGIFTRYPNVTYNKKEKGCAARELLDGTRHKRGFSPCKGIQDGVICVVARQRDRREAVNVWRD